MPTDSNLLVRVAPNTPGKMKFDEPWMLAPLMSASTPQIQVPMFWLTPAVTPIRPPLTSKSPVEMPNPAMVAVWLEVPQPPPPLTPTYRPFHIEIGTGANTDGGGGGGARRDLTPMSAAWAETESKATDAIAAKAVRNFMTIPGICR